MTPTSHAVKCRYGHKFTTKARPGGVTNCPQCNREGRRVQVRISIKFARQGNATDARPPAGAAELAEAARMAAAWETEAPAVAEWRQTPMRPADGEQCSKCGGPMAWHSAHTILVCTACPASAVSPGARNRGREHAEALDRRQARGRAAIADIDPAAEDRARAARLELARRRKALHRYLGQMIAVCKPEAHDEARFTRLGAKLGDALDGYAAEINGAELATLARIAAELREIRDDDGYRALARDAAEVQARREYGDEDQVAESGASRYRRPAAPVVPGYVAPDPDWRRDPGAAAYYAALDSARQTPAVTSAPQRALPVASPYVGLGLTGMMLNTRRARKTATANMLETNGQCGFCARPAVRIYGISFAFGGAQINTSYPNIKACEKHYDAADNWIETNRRGAPAYYWELARTT